ncbi:hypothetical protein H310_08490 [Aphanomyces invadans]|uniref:Uncharacterized protein n=1 Tax=Aphanomyces invadans TaxID=157072 RepID=A0A024U097_9STRA|nr:hypothetical protein H310_08490 [Aphanomyces invadans]ETV99017.1 hypothetical protein H310_08490 [Aphanomyces invadans]|eukprot:XP_008872446.1 hypothetical protein H310_08490 [Aphanomyces invadans]
MNVEHFLAHRDHTPQSFHDRPEVDNRRCKRARPETSLSVWTQVILSSDMMAMIASYQNGIAQDMLPFLVFDPRRLRRRGADMKALLTMDHVHEMLTCWLQAHDVSRLRRLFDRLGYMRFLVAMDAVYYSNISLLDRLHTLFNLATLRGNFLDVAAHTNNLAVLQFLHERGHVGCTTAAMDAAAKHGNLEMVEYLHKRRGEGCTNHGLALATIHCHTAVARYLQDHGLAKYSKNWLATALIRMRSRAPEE